MRLQTFILVVMGVAAVAAGQPNPYALESDARPKVVSGKIVTDAISDATGQVAGNVRTFGWKFQTIPGDPYFIQDPGFNAASGSGFTGGSILGFNLARGLAYWDGAAGSRVDFTQPVPDGHSIDMSFASGILSITTGSAPQPGFPFVSIASNGSAHRHLNSNLRAPGTPLEGVYLTAIRLTNSGGPADSDPLMLLFGNGVVTPELQRALIYVANPLPGDANYSGRTDISDFAILSSNFNQPGAKFWFDGDFNGDYAVNIGDFSILAANFNQTAPAARAPVPEPAASGLIALIAATLLRRMR